MQPATSGPPSGEDQAPPCPQQLSRRSGSTRGGVVMTPSCTTPPTKSRSWVPVSIRAHRPYEGRPSSQRPHPRRSPQWMASRPRPESNGETPKGEPLCRRPAPPGASARPCVPPRGFEPPAPRFGDGCASAALRGHECASLVPTQVCEIAAGLQPAGRAAVHDALGVDAGSRTRTFRATT